MNKSNRNYVSLIFKRAFRQEISNVFLHSHPIFTQHLTAYLRIASAHSFKPSLPDTFLNQIVRTLLVHRSVGNCISGEETLDEEEEEEKEIARVI